MNRLYVECRAALEGDTLVGHAAVFDQVAEIRNGYERLAPTAFDEVLKRPETDVRALMNHDPSLLLGRQSAGTLKLSTDPEGLAFRVDLPDTSYARDLRELVSRGDMTGASFGFIPGEDEFERAKDGKQIRTHVSVSELVDVSPVTFPAYEGASIALRSVVRERVPKAYLQAARIRARILLEGS